MPDSEARREPQGQTDQGNARIHAAIGSTDQDRGFDLGAPGPGFEVRWQILATDCRKDIETVWLTIFEDEFTTAQAEQTSLTQRRQGTPPLVVGEDAGKYASWRQDAGRGQGVVRESSPHFQPGGHGLGMRCG